MTVLPIVDLKDLKDRAYLNEFNTICEQYGVFYLDNHGIKPSVTSGVLREAKKFFNQTLEEKNINLANSKNFFLGYRPIGFEVSQYTNEVERCEQYKIGFNKDSIPFVESGLNMPVFKEYTLQYWQKCLILSEQVLSSISINMGFESDYFNQYMDSPTHQLGMNHYPALSRLSKSQYVMSSHTDMSLFTFLIESNNGLEVKVRGEYIRINPSKNNLIIVIVGEYIEKWSGGRYISPVHRVIGSKENSRISVNYKHRPNFYTTISSDFTKGSPFETGISHEKKLVNILN